MLVAEDDAAADDSDDSYDFYSDDDVDDDNYNDYYNDDYAYDDDDYNEYYNDDYVSVADGIGRYNFRFLIHMSNLGIYAIRLIVCRVIQSVGWQHCLIYVINLHYLFNMCYMLNGICLV